MKQLSPQIGSWYRDIQQGIIFEIVAIDDESQTIATQLLDGEVSECDLESWNEMLLEAVEEPGDWRNGYELSSEDYLNSDDTIHPENWDGPLNMIETDIINGIFDDPY